MKLEWLKFKKYPHIGIPLRCVEDKHWIVNYITNPENIASHKFVPFLHKTISQKKYRPDNPVLYNPSGKRTRKHYKPKKREIFYPTHFDSLIYSYYSFLLVQAYEEYLSNKPYSTVAVAYRKIPNSEKNAGNKCNIEFAKETFEFILNNKHRNLSVIVADVTSFFDNLNHRLLHKQWKKVLNVLDLPKDHYAVFKSLIDYKYVHEKELYNRFRNKLIVERHKNDDPKGKKVKKNKLVKCRYNLRRENVIAYCTTKDFFKKALDLIHCHKFDCLAQNMEFNKGIPQGTPISATLANIYMLDFDACLYSEVSSPGKNGYYQRYSDDLVIICDQKDEDYFYNLVRKQIEVISKLDIQTDKTHIFRYALDDKGSFKGGLLKDGAIFRNKQLEYLGFSFDGKRVRVKTVAFSKFYRKMKRSFRRGAHYAVNGCQPSHSLYEWRLYKKFTHLGARRRLKWKRNGELSKYYRTAEYDWGNFISYLNKANAVMRSINQDDCIKRQYRKIWKNFHLLKMKTYEEISSLL